MSRVETIGNRATLYLGDARNILPTLQMADALVTDPPYGIGRDGQKQRTGGHNGRKAHEFLNWDGERPDAAMFELLIFAAKQHIIWGGNYFADMLPPQMKWLVWDKGQRINQSDGELAYTTIGGALRIMTINRAELLKDETHHPTQKPVQLMKWCIEQLRQPSERIIDPFMGSGSTGVAALKMGKTFIGIEREQKYFDIARRRLDEAVRQPDMFIEPAPAYEQATLALPE